MVNEKFIGGAAEELFEREPESEWALVMSTEQIMTFLLLFGKAKTRVLLVAIPCNAYLDKIMAMVSSERFGDQDVVRSEAKDLYLQHRRL